jgi:hypothetical protein
MCILFMDTVIMTSAEIDKLIALGNFYTKTFQLIYRGSRDSFTASAFHEKCDFIANTVTVVKSTVGFVFGGFTTQTWDGSTSKEDAQAFIFSLRRNVSGFNILTDAQRFNSSSPAIFADPTNGPIFGSGYDFYVTNNANISLSTCVFCWSYTCPAGLTRRSLEASSYISGADPSYVPSGPTYYVTYKVQDYEVFKVL